MKFIELTQPPQQEGQGVVTIKAVIDQINFATKQSLQPVFMVALAGAALPCIGTYQDVLDGLESAGFILFDTPDGSQAAVNAKHVAFFVSPQLGIYNLMFVGKAGLIVKATLAEIEGMFEENKSPIIGA